MNPVFRNILSAALMLSALAGCSSGAGGKKAGAQAGVQAGVVAAHFPMVKAPVMMDNAGKAEYLAGHFWEEFLAGESISRQDSLVLGGVPREEVEQAVADYVMLLSNEPLEKAEGHVSSFVEALAALERTDTSSAVFEDLSALFVRYIYDPNSPVRDEDIYTPFARAMASCDLLDPAVREAYAGDVRLTSLNRRGTKAADFSFSDTRGRRHSLYGIKAQRTILFFSNPGCTACKEIIEALDSDPVISELTASGDVAVLNIYIDEDVAGWMEYMPIYPERWYNGYDDNHVIRDENLYNIRAIPSLYLLDEGKRVMLKDTDVERLMNNL